MEIKPKFDADFVSSKCNWVTGIAKKDQPSTRELFNSRKVFEHILANNDNVLIDYVLSEGRFNWGAIAWYKIDKDLVPAGLLESTSEMFGVVGTYNGNTYVKVAYLNDGPTEPGETSTFNVYKKLMENLDRRLEIDSEKFYQYWLKDLKYHKEMYKGTYKPYLPWSDSKVDVDEALLNLKPEYFEFFEFIRHNSFIIKEKVMAAYKDALAYWYELRDSGEKYEAKKPKGYTAVYDNQDGSFSYICSGSNEEQVREVAEYKHDNERVRVYPYYDSPYEVL